MNKESATKPDIIHKINDQIMQFKYNPDLNTAPAVHKGLNPFYMEMRQEVYKLHNVNIKQRRVKMRELFIKDFLQETKELGEVHFGYINTQP